MHSPKSFTERQNRSYRSTQLLNFYSLVPAAI